MRCIFFLQQQQNASDVVLVQVTVTVCREGALQEVAVRLGMESALGTTSLVHFCGAQFQVPLQVFPTPVPRLQVPVYTG